MVQGISPALSALKVLERKMAVSANNVANAATTGFKKGRATGSGQVTTAHQQGPLLPTASPSDLAIGGEGYFVLRDAAGGTVYSRDGGFHFDRGGRLTDATGNTVRGWAIDPATGWPAGGLTDVTLGPFSAPPRATTEIRLGVNLDAAAADHSPGGLTGQWRGNADPPLSSEASAYSQAVTVYDALGAPHDVTVYFDKGGGASEWEYIVTSLPGEDRRAGAGGADLGLLASGTLSFDPQGVPTGMTMQRNDGAGNWTPVTAPADLLDGHFAFQADFQGAAGGSSAVTIQLDLGIRHDGAGWIPVSGGSTQYAAASATLRFGANGAGAGALLSVAVSPDGIVSGHYSNGETADLFQLAVATFPNPAGLETLGGNRFRETAASGVATTVRPGEGGAGRLVPHALEGANVDLAEAFSQMILYQRGFEANVKALGVEDEMKGAVLDILT